MAYDQKLKDKVAALPKTLGTRLARWAIHLDFPVTKISRYTGATRMTVYNWFSGKDVVAYYRPHVEDLIKILQSSSTADDAWRKICQQNPEH